jgi:hypothetical protein
LAAVVFATAGAANPATVRDAASRLYIHGMTASLAESEIGRDGVPALLSLLEDPAFPRKDNVVAFLAYLGGDESTHRLMVSLDRPLPSGASPEEIRARLLVPHALGRIARRGNAAALETLLAATADRAAGGPIGAAARRGGYPAALQDALARESISALALAGGAVARARLQAIAEGKLVPDAARDVRERARSALKLFEELGENSAAAATTGTIRSAPSMVGNVSPPSVAPAVATIDTAPRSRGHFLGFANHPDLADPMTTERLDAVFADATRRAGVADDEDDVACCTQLTRSGSPMSFGSSGDGLDTIDDAAQLSGVLESGAARVKLVNAINYCGGAGTNIIGCSYVGGKGMALVRMSSLSYEAVLWIHEYGHNIGLSHAPDPRALMYGTVNGANDVLSEGECLTFHKPSSLADAVTSDIGTCTDDGDSFADPLDNCPLMANENQVDVNADGIGDDCEATAPLSADTDSSGRVDGVDLARLGRAFGAPAGDPRYDVAVDLNRDGVVDGADLALMAASFGERRS